MGVRILHGEYDGSTTGACLVDSVTGLAFGPLFDDGDEAEALLEWLGAEDARLVKDWPDTLAKFREDQEQHAGEAAWEAHCESFYGGSGPATLSEQADAAQEVKRRG